MNTIVEDIVNAIMFTIIYFTYIAINPSTKGIVFRLDDTNKHVFSYQSIIAFIKFPFTRQGIKIMWLPQNLDINYAFLLTVFFGVYKILKKN
jgi:hypothetical protein